MVETVLTARIQMRNDTATRWAICNPVLLIGEIGVESDDGKFKIGDGVTAWNDLAYMVYIHPASHPAVMIVQDSKHLFVTDEEKGVWYNAASEIGAHLPDSTAHIIAAERTKWDAAASEIGAHLPDSTAHIIAAERTKWDAAASEIGEHLSNSTTHITAAERTKWDAVVDSIGEIGAVLDAINGEVV